MFQEAVLQFHTRIPSQNAVVNSNQVNILNHDGPAVRCFRCGGGHYVEECPILMCRKCSGQHDFKDCTLLKEKLVCTKCNLRGHTTKAHYGPLTKRVHKYSGASRGVQQRVYMQSWRCSYPQLTLNLRQSWFSAIVNVMAGVHCTAIVYTICPGHSAIVAVSMAGNSGPL